MLIHHAWVPILHFLCTDVEKNFLFIWKGSYMVIKSPKNTGLSFMQVKKSSWKCMQKLVFCILWHLKPHLSGQIMVFVMDCSQVEYGQPSTQDGGTLKQGKERLLGHSHFHCHLVHSIHKGDATAWENFAPDNLWDMKKAQFGMKYNLSLSLSGIYKGLGFLHICQWCPFHAFALPLYLSIHINFLLVCYPFCFFLCWSPFLHALFLFWLAASQFLLNQLFLLSSLIL